MLSIYTGGIIGLLGLSYLFRSKLTILLLDLYTKFRYLSISNNNNLQITTIDNTNNKIVSKYTNINTIIVETANNAFIVTPNMKHSSLILSITILIDNQEKDITKVLSKYLMDNINITKHQLIEILEYNKINYTSANRLDIIDNNADSYMIDFTKDFILFCNTNTPLLNIQYL